MKLLTKPQLIRIYHYPEFKNFVDAFEYNGVERIHLNMVEFKDDLLSGYQTFVRGEIYAMWYDNNPVGIGGVIPYNDYSGYVWMLLNPEPKCLKTVVSTIHGLIYKFLFVNKLIRLFSFVVADTPAERFIRHFGFYEEGFMKHFYGWNIHAKIYGLTREI
ncbi:MAG: hypothetical protein KatS3mg087_1652 [Patescibacteria group bacterium]|nr:MAG: hypothetical protein KatS3mg087_1652 [Patescibacteria group bacterium]